MEEALLVTDAQPCKMDSCKAQRGNRSAFVAAGLIWVAMLAVEMTCQAAMLPKFKKARTVGGDAANLVSPTFLFTPSAHLNISMNCSEDQPDQLTNVTGMIEEPDLMFCVFELVAPPLLMISFKALYQLFMQFLVYLVTPKDFNDPFDRIKRLLSKPRAYFFERMGENVEVFSWPSIIFQVVGQLSALWSYHSIYKATEPVSLFTWEDTRHREMFTYLLSQSAGTISLIVGLANNLMLAVALGAKEFTPQVHYSDDFTGASQLSLAISKVLPDENEDGKYRSPVPEDEVWAANGNNFTFKKLEEMRGHEDFEKNFPIKIFTPERMEPPWQWDEKKMTAKRPAIILTITGFSILSIYLYNTIWACWWYGYVVTIGGWAVGYFFAAVMRASFFEIETKTDRVGLRVASGNNQIDARFISADSFQTRFKHFFVTFNWNDVIIICSFLPMGLGIVWILASDWNTKAFLLFAATVTEFLAPMLFLYFLYAMWDFGPRSFFGRSVMAFLLATAVVYISVMVVPASILNNEPDVSFGDAAIDAFWGKKIAPWFMYSFFAPADSREVDWEDWEAQMLSWWT